MLRERLPLSAQVTSMESMIGKDKKLYSKSLKINVVKRILSTLRENGHVKRTNLAGKTGLNYETCMKYVNLLRLLTWIEVIYDKDYFVVITEKGREISETFERTII